MGFVRSEILCVFHPFVSFTYFPLFDSGMALKKCNVSDSALRWLILDYINLKKAGILLLSHLWILNCEIYK